MNALSIVYVNAHLQDLLDEAAQHRVERPDRPSLLKRIASAASNAWANLGTPLDNRGIDVPGPRRHCQPELRTPPFSFVQPPRRPPSLQRGSSCVCRQVGRSSGTSTSRRVDAGRVVRSPGRGRDHRRRRAPPRSARSRRSPPATSRSRRLDRRRIAGRPSAAGGDRPGPRAPQPRAARARRASRARTAGTSVGMSPPTTTTRSSAGSSAARPVARPGERALEGARIVGDRDAGERRRRRIGRDHHDDVGRHDARTASTACSSIGRPSIGSASLSRPNRDDRPPARTHGRDRARSSTDGGGCLRARHVPVGRPPQDRPPVEVLEDRHDVLAARAGRVAERGRRQRRAARPSTGPVPPGRGTSTSRRRGPVRGRRSARPARGRGCRPAGSRRPARHRRGAAGRRRRARPRAGPSRRPTAGSGVATTTPGRRTTSPSRTRRPSATSRSTASAAATGAASSRRMVDGPAQGPSRPPSGRSASGATGSTAASAASAAQVVDVRARAGRPSAPWRSSRATRPRSARRRSRGRPTRSAVCRRREMPRGGVGSRTTPPTGSIVGPAAQDEPVARPEPRRLGQPDDPGRAAVGQVERVATAPPDRGVRRPPSRRGAGPALRSATGASERREDRGRSRRPRVGREDHAAVHVGRIDAGEVERRPATVVDAVDGRAVDLDLADPDRPGRPAPAAASRRGRADRRAACRSRRRRGP